MSRGKKGKSSRENYLSEDEQRKVRPYVELYIRNKQYMYPDDDKSIQELQRIFLETVDYIFKRCSDRGYA